MSKCGKRKVAAHKLRLGKSLTSVKFCEKKEMMSFIVTPGDDYKNTTKGLLGTWNDNPDDDFTLPDGTELPSSLTLKEIHFNFGVKCK